MLDVSDSEVSDEDVVFDDRDSTDESDSEVTYDSDTIDDTDSAGESERDLEVTDDSDIFDDGQMTDEIPNDSADGSSSEDSDDEENDLTSKLSKLKLRGDYSRQDMHTVQCMQRVRGCNVNAVKSKAPNKGNVLFLYIMTDN